MSALRSPALWLTVLAGCSPSAPPPLAPAAPPISSTGWPRVRYGLRYSDPGDLG